MLARAYVADAVHDVASRVLGRSPPWNVERDALAGAMPFVAEHRAPEFLESLADQCVKHGTGPTHLSEDFELVAETFRRFADDKIRPAAEHVHRTNADVPEDIINGLAELGGFGLSVPEEYGGFATGGESTTGHGGATEELSRARSASAVRRHPARDPHPRVVRAGPRSRRAWLPARERRLMVGTWSPNLTTDQDVAA